MDHKSRAARYRVGMNLIYDTGEGYWSAPVIDVSESGLFVETHHELPIGTRVTAHPDVPKDDEQLPFEIRAEVVRTQEYDPENYFDRTPGLAFHFVDLPVTQRQQIMDYLAARGVASKRSAK